MDELVELVGDGRTSDRSEELDKDCDVADVVGESVEFSVSVDTKEMPRNQPERKHSDTTIRRH